MGSTYGIDDGTDDNYRIVVFEFGIHESSFQNGLEGSANAIRCAKERGPQQLISSICAY